jgi:hypothetical protein
MGPACSVKENSNPLRCGVHNVLLVQRHSSEESRTAFFGNFTFYVCPVSNAVVSDAPPTKKTPTS